MFKVGIIGCGDISQLHYEGFAKTGRAAVTAVWSRSPASRDAAAAKWGAKVFDTAEALIASDVDIVTICTPGFARMEYILPAARAGKHILCEKPLALNVKDGLAIQKAVGKSGITFMVAFNLRFDPRMRCLRTVQESGQIGKVVSAWYRVHVPGPSARWRQIQASGHWRASPELSGGRITEFGGHGMDWLVWTLGQPLSVYGKSLFVTEGFTVDDANYGIINFRDGVATVEIQRNAAIPQRFCCGIVGHGGSVMVEQDKILFTPMDAPTVELPPETGFPSKHAHFLDCIENHITPQNNVDDALWTVRACAAFNRSAQTNKVANVK